MNMREKQGMKTGLVSLWKESLGELRDIYALTCCGILAALAVALKYKKGMIAPLVIAKGQDLVAEKIKQIARENYILIVENKPVARALYEAVEVGGSVPAELYQAVAEILAYVYRIKHRKVA